MAIFNCIHDESYDTIIDYVGTLSGIDEIDDRGYTLLRYAVEFSRDRRWGILVVKYLIERGANVNYQNPEDKYYNLLCCAAEFGCIGSAKALMATGLVVETPPSITPPLSRAHFRPLMMKYLIGIGCDPNYKDEHNTTLLMVAVQRGPIESVCVLLSAGVNIESVDTYGYTALHYAHGCDNDGIPYDNGYERYPKVCEVIRAEIVRRDEMKLAFAMAGHLRLGENTRMKNFDPQLINFILELVQHKE